MQTIFFRILPLSCAMVLSAWCFLALPAHAAVIRTGDTVSIGEDSVVPGDFYALGGDITISGIIEGDAYVMGGTVTVNGTIKGDLLIVGGTVSVHGVVSDDVRALVGKVVVAEHVAGDVAAVAGSLASLSTAHIDGDVLFYGGEAKVEGEVKGEVHARAESLMVNGSVGSVDAILSNALSLGDNARVAGPLAYQSPRALVRSTQAVITGTITESTVAEEQARFFDTHLPLWFMVLFSSLVAVLLLKDRVLRMVSARGAALPYAALVGLGIVVITPLAFGLLIASVLGGFAGALLMVLYVGLLLASLILMHVVAGAFIAKYTVHEYKVTWLWTTIGVVVVQGVFLIPFIGPLAVCALFVVTVGMIAHYLYSSLRS